MKSRRYVKVAENMLNYLSNISWEWEDRSQESTGKERTKRAPETCEVYMYLSQKCKCQPVSYKWRDKGGKHRGAGLDTLSPPIIPFYFLFLFSGINPAKEAAEKRKLQPLMLPTGTSKQLKQISWGLRFHCFCWEHQRNHSQHFPVKSFWCYEPRQSAFP